MGEPWWPAHTPHGTDRGHQWHVTHHIPACEPCKHAHAAAERRRRGTEITRLELERLRPAPPPDPLGESFRRLLDLIAGECRRAGMLPP